MDAKINKATGQPMKGAELVKYLEARGWQVRRRDDGKLAWVSYRGGRYIKMVREYGYIRARVEVYGDGSYSLQSIPGSRRNKIMYDLQMLCAELTLAELKNLRTSLKDKPVAPAFKPSTVASVLKHTLPQAQKSQNELKGDK